VQAQYHKYGINIRKVDNNTISFSFDEVSNLYDLDQLVEVFASIKKKRFTEANYMPFEHYEGRIYQPMPKELARTSKYLQQQ